MTSDRAADTSSTEGKSTITTVNPTNIAIIQKSFEEAELQIHDWSEYTNNQPPLQSHSSGHGPRTGWLTRRRRVTSRDLENGEHQLCDHSCSPTNSNRAIDWSLAQAVKERSHLLLQRPGTDVLLFEDILISFGAFLAGRLWHRGKIIQYDPVTAAKVLLPASKSLEPVTRSVNLSFNLCLSDVMPEGHKSTVEPPPATQEAVRCLMSLWPRTLEEANLLHQTSCNLPTVARWLWLHNGRHLETETEAPVMNEINVFNHVCNGESKTVGTGDRLVGSMCYFALDTRANVLSIRDIVHSANHLLDHILYASDPVRERKMFGQLDKFLFPLTDQLHPIRDNREVGPWSNCDGPFSWIFHHLRCLDGDDVSCGRDPFPGSFGLKLNRVSREFSTQFSPSPKITRWVGERRISIAVLARHHDPDVGRPGPKRYNGLLLVSPGFDEYMEWRSPPNDLVQSSGLEPVDGIFAPVYCFLGLYVIALDIWTRNWWHLVEAVEKLLQDDDILSQNSLHGLYEGFDDVDQYFDIIRLLRKAVCWVESTGTDFSRAQASIMQLDQTHLEHYGVMKDNFDLVRKELQSKIDALTTKMERMLHDVKTFREDLQSSASLREISVANDTGKRMKTLATVTTYFLPANLLAAICGNSIEINFNSGWQLAAFLFFTVLLVLIVWWFFIPFREIRFSRFIEEKRAALRVLTSKAFQHRSNSLTRKVDLLSSFEDAFSKFESLLGLKKGVPGKRPAENSSADRSTVESHR